MKYEELAKEEANDKWCVKEPAGAVYGTSCLTGIKHSAPMHCNNMPCCFTEEEFDEEVRLSEASGNASNEEVRDFFAQYGLVWQH